MEVIDPSLSIARASLAVSDLERSSSFYEQVLGLPLLQRGDGRALLGDPVRAPVRSTGLFHVAWLHPTRAALADTVRRVALARWRIDGASDHLVSEALYLSDPDGLGIEIYADRPRDQWQRPPSGRGVVMSTEPLDVDDLLAQSAGEPAPRIDPRTVIGHVHMKVSDVPRALGYYRDVLGFEEQAELGSAAFVSAGGYHHHIGLNSWESRGGSPAPANAPGLRRVELTLGSPEALAEMAGDPLLGGSLLGADAERLTVRDPDGQLLQFSAR